MRASGTTAWSSFVVLLWVARMPSVSQSSSVVTPPSSRVRKPCTSRGPSSVPGPSVCLPKTASRVQAGASEVKIFVPVNAYPPSTRSAVVSESHSTRSLPGSLRPNANSSPASASASTQSRLASPRSCSTRAMPVIDEVHVDRESGRRGVRAEQALVAHDLEQRARREVSRGAQLLEILGEEDVVAVVAGGPRADAVEQFRVRTDT